MLAGILACALAGPAPAQANVALPTAATLCQPAQPQSAPPADLPAEQKRVQGLLNATHPDAHAAACALAWLTQDNAGAGSPQALAALVPVLEAMLQQQLQRTEVLLQFAQQLHQGLDAAGAAHAVAATRLAGKIALLHDIRHELDSAMAWSLKVARVLDTQPEQFDAYTLWSERINHALRLIDARQFTAADQHLQATLSAVQGQRDLVVLHANALSAMAGSAVRQQRRDEAARINQDILALRLRALPDDRAGLALARHNVAVNLHRSGHYDQAEAMYRAAVATLGPSDADPNHHRVEAYTGLGSLLVTRGRAADGLAAHASAHALLQARGDANTPRAAQVLFFMASAQINVGRWGDAARTLRLCLALLQGSGQRAGYFSTWGANMLYGQVMTELGDLPEAQAALDRALSHARQTGAAPNLMGNLHVHRATLLEALGQADAAVQALGEAEAAFAALYPAQARARRAVLTRRCLLDEAPACGDLQRLLADAQALRSAPLPPDLEAHMSLALARQQQRLGQPAAARPWALRAIVASHSGQAADAQWLAYMALASALHAQGQADEAIALAKRAINIVQGMRSGLSGLGATAEAGYLRNKHQNYRSLADWLMQAGRLGEALEVLAQLKATEQDDFTERATPAGPTALSLTPLEQGLLARLDQQLSAADKASTTDARARQLLGATRLTEAESAELNQWLQARQAARADEVHTLAALLAAAQGANATRPQAGPAVPLGRLQTLASRPWQRHVLHAHLVWGHEQLNLLTLSAGGQRLQRLALRRQDIDRDIGAFLDALQQRGNVLPWAQLLYRQVGQALDEAARAQGATEIKLWLDGGLRYLPFAALHDGQRYLVQKYRLVLAPALAQPAAAGTVPPPAPTRITAFGVSQAQPGYAALPAVGEELCAIVNGPVRGLDGPAAACRQTAAAQGTGPLPGEADLNLFFTEKRLRSATNATAAEPRQPSLLHIGTHFVLRPGNVARSWLLLGDGQTLTLEALRSLALQNTQLVTLSACQSGLPGAGADGVEVDGLPAALLGRGAIRVLASLWKVDDQHTATLMRRFYAELARRPGDFAGALQAAQRASLGVQTGQASHPAHWAAFNLTDASR